MNCRGCFALVLVVTLGFGSSGCELDSPTDSTVPANSPVPNDSVQDSPDTTWGFRDPIVPDAGGSPLIGSSTDPDPDEIDCDDAEDLCDSGAFACDDIADYCDIGPDDGSELPDDYDWDQ